MCSKESTPFSVSQFSRTRDAAREGRLSFVSARRPARETIIVLFSVSWIATTKRVSHVVLEIVKNNNNNNNKCVCEREREREREREKEREFSVFFFFFRVCLFSMIIYLRDTARHVGRVLFVACPMCRVPPTSSWSWSSTLLLFSSSSFHAARSERTMEHAVHDRSSSIVEPQPQPQQQLLHGQRHADKQPHRHAHRTRKLRLQLLLLAAYSTVSYASRPLHPIGHAPPPPAG